jgi:hypothetical protein
MVDAVPLPPKDAARLHYPLLRVGDTFNVPSQRPAGRRAWLGGMLV